MKKKVSIISLEKQKSSLGLSTFTNAWPAEGIY